MGWLRKHSVLIKRIITALILLPLVIWAIFALSPLYFVLAVGLVLCLAAWEWASLMNLKKNRILYVVLFVFCLILFLIIPSETILIISLFWWLTAFVLILTYPSHIAFWQKHVARKGFVGVLMIAPTIVGFKVLKVDYGPWYILYCLLIIWTADITAYFVGRGIGRIKLLPTVSPGKTVEGVFGALIAGILLAFICQRLIFDQQVGMLKLILLTEATMVLSIVGDLTESMFKRAAGAKDSGSLLPGHGGILDRIDGLVAAVPIFALGVWIF